MIKQEQDLQDSYMKMWQYVVNVLNVLLFFVNAFGELTDEIMQFISNIYLRYLILYLRCKLLVVFRMFAIFCRFTAGYFNLGHPVH